MKGILIAFTLPTGKNRTKSSAFVKAFYGQETSSHHGKYKYRRNGILDEIPHNKLIRGVVILKSKDARQVIEFLEKQSAQYHIRVVELSKEDCIAMGLSTE
jgi:NOL1/NOP2/fmu family ribosome biogenesis protein